MGSDSNKIGTVMASVFITLLISGAGMYFGLPALFPNMNKDLDDYVLKSEIDDTGIILQSQSHETDTTAHISDEDDVAAQLLDTAMNFTTQGGSKIKVSFDAMFVLILSSGFSSTTRYNITLSVGGIQNKSAGILYYSGSATTTTTELSYSIHIAFETSTLPAGTYSILVYWNSEWISASSSTLYAGPGSLKYPRTIAVEEISV